MAFQLSCAGVICTTNSSQSLNYQLRKIIKNRNDLFNDDAVIKLLWLAICNIEDKRAWQRVKERGRPSAERKAPGRLVEGQIVTNWKQALAQLAIVFPDRITTPLTEEIRRSAPVVRSCFATAAPRSDAPPTAASSPGRDADATTDPASQQDPLRGIVWPTCERWAAST